MIHATGMPQISAPPTVESSRFLTLPGSPPGYFGVYNSIASDAASLPPYVGHRHGKRIVVVVRVECREIRSPPYRAAAVTPSGVTECARERWVCRCFPSAPRTTGEPPLARSVRRAARGHVTNQAAARQDPEDGPVWPSPRRRLQRVPRRDKPGPGGGGYDSAGCCSLPGRAARGANSPTWMRRSRWRPPAITSLGDPAHDEPRLRWKPRHRDARGARDGQRRRGLLRLAGRPFGSSGPRPSPMTPPTRLSVLVRLPSTPVPALPPPSPQVNPESQPCWGSLAWEIWLLTKASVWHGSAQRCDLHNVNHRHVLLAPSSPEIRDP